VVTNEGLSALVLNLGLGERRGHPVSASRKRRKGRGEKREKRKNFEQSIEQKEIQTKKKHKDE
jgi:hypothetical protein